MKFFITTLTFVFLNLLQDNTYKECHACQLYLNRAGEIYVFLDFEFACFSSNSMYLLNINMDLILDILKFRRKYNYIKESK